VKLEEPIMNSPQVAAAAALLLSVALLAARAAEPGVPSDLESANALFKVGKFADAEKRYAQVVAQYPKHFAATVRLGNIALLANRLDEAQKWLEKAVAIKPDDRDAKLQLAEAFYRRDEFQQAAPLLRAAGQEAKAKKLASFKDQTPYQIQGKGDKTMVKFVMTDPLPVVKVRVNGGKEVNFFLDTGASEVILDNEFARELGIEQFGSEEGTFAGGKKAAVHHGRIDSLTLGDWELKNLPVATIDTRQLSEGFGGKQIDGAMGTVLFYHFLATLDYPQGELILRRKTRENLTQVDQAPAGPRVIVPFWMADDHFMVAWSRIEKREPELLFVDTGLTDGAAKLTETVIKEAGIPLDKAKAVESTGGGGKLQSIPFTLKELSLGEASEKNVRGWFEGPFPWEYSFGFRLAGMVGHEFFRPYAVTFDFDGMRIILERKS
jgi:predicted aspartyl protease